MKNIFIGISMLVLAFYLLFQQTQQQQELSEKNRHENPGAGTSGNFDSNESFLLPEESSFSRKTYIDGNNREFIQSTLKHSFYQRIWIYS
jgi:hypothetical protein